MAKYLSICLILLFALAALASANTALYVAQSGASTNDGSRRHPLPTLEDARDVIRAMRKTGGLPKGGVIVWIRGGTYYLAQPFTLSAADSGTPESPITYRAAPGEVVRLVGGKAVTAWSKVADPAILARLDPLARDHVLRTDLNPLGYRSNDEAFIPGKRCELFFDDKPMILARWPATGFATIADVTTEGATTMNGLAGSKIGKFHYTDDRPAKWSLEKDIWLHGYWFWDWFDEYQHVSSIDTATKTITLDTPYATFGYRKGQRYYAENLLCELNRPGEYYLDRSTGLLYFWPPTDPVGKHAVVSILPTLVQMQDVSFVTTQGFTLEASRDTAIVLSGGLQCSIAGCVIRNVGMQAVEIDGGTGHRVIGCDISNTGAASISLTGGDRKTLTPAGLTVENCVIHGFGRLLRTYHPAVDVNGVGNRVVHNLIYDGPHNAILMTGNDHLIAYNDISHVCYESGDVGAFYIGRNWTERGNVVRDNYFHDISGPGLYGATSVYLDDCASGTAVTGNLFVNAGMGVELGGGRDNIVDNNVFVKCAPAIQADSRGLDWASMWVVPGGTLHEALKEVPYTTPPWSTRYPQLVNILQDDPGAPKGVRVTHNINFDGRWLDVDDKAKPLLYLEGNLTDSDPHFVDASGGNFGLRPNSPAFALGFKALDLDKFGVYKDDLRATWPVAPPAAAPAALAGSAKAP